MLKNVYSAAVGWNVLYFKKTLKGYVLDRLWTGCEIGDAKETLTFLDMIKAL